MYTCVSLIRQIFQSGTTTGNKYKRLRPKRNLVFTYINFAPKPRPLQNINISQFFVVPLKKFFQILDDVLLFLYRCSKLFYLWLRGHITLYSQRRCTINMRSLFQETTAWQFIPKFRCLIDS